jgi:hypothetical protein
LEEKSLRDALTQLLQGGEAHLGVEKALDGLRPESRNRRPAGGAYSVWELLEHMRIAQEDILRYTIDPSWESPDWPEGYWPADTGEIPDHQWNRAVTGFKDDLGAVLRIVADGERDLTTEIAHGKGGHTYLREILLVADHNAYHLGQIVQTRKLLGNW